MNRGTLRAEVALRLRIPTTGDPLLDDVTLNDTIRAALIDVSAVTDWPWLLTSSSLTFTAGLGPLPSNCVKVRELMVNSVRAQAVGNAEYFDAIITPSYWVYTVLGSNIALTPVPTAPASPTNVLWYIQTEPALTTDVQSPLIPEAHQQTLLARACYHAEVRRGRAEAASFHNAEYERGLTMMKDAGWRKTGPRQIRQSNTTWFARW